MTVYDGEWLAATIAAAGTSSAEVNLGKSCSFLQIQIPTLTSATVKIQVAESSGGTFYDLGDTQTTTAGTHNYTTTLKLGGFQFIKVVTSVAQGAERLIRVRGMRY